MFDRAGPKSSTTLDSQLNQLRDMIVNSTLIATDVDAAVRRHINTLTGASCPPELPSPTEDPPGVLPALLGRMTNLHQLLADLSALLEDHLGTAALPKSPFAPGASQASLAEGAFPPANLG